MHAALTEPILQAAPTPRDPAAWTRSTEELRFFLGGRDLGALRVPAMTLNVPFTHLNTNLEDNAPTDDFPSGVEAFVIPAQPIAAEFPRITFLPGLVRYIGPSTNRYSINLQGTFAEYMKKFSAKHRYNLTRSIKQFAEYSGGEIDWKCFQAAEDMKMFYRHADEIARNSWGAILGRASFANRVPETELLRLAQQNMARGFVLFHGKQPIAYALCASLGEHLLYEYVAYDQDYAKWSPGSILLYLLIENLFAEQNFRCLDLGEGTLGYKAHFASNSVRCARVIYFRRNARNSLLVALHSGICSASVGAGRLMRHMGLKQKLKRAMMGKTYRPGQAG